MFSFSQNRSKFKPAKQNWILIQSIWEKLKSLNFINFNACAYNAYDINDLKKKLNIVKKRSKNLLNHIKLIS